MATVFPGSAARARYLIRAHKSELVTAGAIVRVGRELVTIGSKYIRWLETRVQGLSLHRELLQELSAGTKLLIELWMAGNRCVLNEMGVPLGESRADASTTH